MTIGMKIGSAAEVQISVLPDVDHTFAYRDASDAYKKQVIPFLCQLRQRAA